MKKVVIFMLAAALLASPAAYAEGGFSPDAKAFSNPDNKYRAYQLEHYWQDAESAKLDLTQLREYGLGGFVTNVKWTKDYLLDPEAFRLTDENLTTGRGMGLNTWIYDEHTYPSGTARQLVVDGHPEFESRGIREVKLTGTGTGKQELAIPEYTVEVLGAALYPVADGAADRQHAVSIKTAKNDKTIVTEGMEGDWELRCWVVFPSFPGDEYFNTEGFDSPRKYTNLLDRDAVARFIDVTYRAYRDNLSPESWKNIEAFFTDEPYLMTVQHDGAAADAPPLVPWSKEMEARFEKDHGYPLTEALPSLFGGDTEHDKLCRVNFYQTVGNLMSENYFGQIADWCAQNGTLGSGHLLLEENMAFHVPLYGDYMKCTGKMGKPGTDILNVTPESYITDKTIMGVKFASSASRWQNKPLPMTEICPVAGMDTWTPNHLNYTMGVASLLYLNGTDHLNDYYPIPTQTAESSNTFNQYVGRLGYMLDGAQMDSEIAVYYPIESAQAQYYPKTRNTYDVRKEISDQDAYLYETVMTLMRSQLDFNFLNDDALRAVKLENGRLNVGGSRYKIMIVPNAEVMSADAMQLLTDFKAQGGKVFFLNRLPSIGFSEAETPKVSALAKGFAGDEYQLGADYGENLAYGAKVTVSSKEDNETYQPEYITDGNNGVSQWESWSTNILPAWAEIDLGEMKTFDKAVVYTQSGYEQKEYNLQYWNGQNWINLIPTVDNNTQSKIMHDFAPVTASKVRICMTRGNVKQDSDTERVARITELELYNSAANQDQRDFTKELLTANAATCRITPPADVADKIYASSYTKDGSRMHYIVNSLPADTTVAVNVEGANSLTVCDPTDGSIKTVPNGSTLPLKGYMGLFVLENGQEGA